MKAIGYVRVSTEEQAKEGISLENQKDRIRSYCTYKGLDLTHIIEDAGISGGKNKARPGFVSLMDRIESNGIEAVVLYSLERLSRDMLTLLALERLLDEKDIELHTVEGQVDTGNPDGWLNFAMKAFLGEMERRQVKHRTKKAMEYKKNQGAVVGSVPYGFRRERNDLVADLHEQRVVTLINTLYGQSMRLTHICKELKHQGMATRKGKDFTPEQIRRIITGYEGKFTKTNTRLSRNIREFVEAIA